MRCPERVVLDVLILSFFLALLGASVFVATVVMEDEERRNKTLLENRRKMENQRVKPRQI